MYNVTHFNCFVFKHLIPCMYNNISHPQSHDVNTSMNIITEHFNFQVIVLEIASDF